MFYSFVADVLSIFYLSILNFILFCEGEGEVVVVKNCTTHYQHIIPE